MVFHLALQATELVGQKECAGCIERWTSLGDDWWKMFVDGASHWQGPHAFDRSGISTLQGQDGEFIGHLRDEYETWARPDAPWGMRWDANALEALNTRLQGTVGH